MKYKLLTSLFILIFILISGVVYANQVHENKKIKTGDLPFQAQKAKERVENMNIPAFVEEKVVLRVALGNEMNRVQMNENELINYAQSWLEEHNRYLNLAKELFNVSVTDEEVISLIKQELTVLKENDEIYQEVKEFANSLGFTVDELYYDFDFEAKKKVIVWQGISKELQKQYPMLTNEKPIEYNERLLSKWYEILEKHQKR